MGNSVSSDEFLLACQNNDVTNLKKQLKLKVNVNIENSFGVTGLHTACAYGNTDIVSLLLANNVDVNKLDARGDSPLIISVRGGHEKIIQQLLKSKCDIDLKNKNGITALHVACQAGIMSIVTLLLNAGGDSTILDNDMKSCLDYLSEEKKEEIKTIHSSNKRQKVDNTQESNGDISEVVNHLIDCGLSNTKSHVISVLMQKQGIETVKMLFHLANTGKLMNILENLGPQLLPLDIEVIMMHTQSKLVGVGTLRRSETKEYDCFLSHNWQNRGENNNENHEKVRLINEKLKDKGRLHTWFDHDRVLGDVREEMLEGIDKSKIILIFITETYQMKLKNNSDACRMEFNYSVNQKPGRMIPVVMEKGMRNQKEWKGTLGAVLGSHKYVDFSEAFDNSKIFNEKIDELLEIMAKLLQKRTSS